MSKDKHALIKANIALNKRVRKLKKQNKHFRKALEEILESTMTIPDYREHSYHAERTAFKALKAEEFNNKKEGDQ